MDGTPTGATGRRLARWGALASFATPVALVVSSLIYLTGDLRHPLGALSYDLADVLAGPLLGALLVVGMLALVERMGERGSRRGALALLAAALAAAAFVAVAMIRSANREYFITHPDMNYTTVLVVWGTLVAGLSATAWHFLGWAWLLVGVAGWRRRTLPRTLSALYLVGGALAPFNHLLPQDGEGLLMLVAALIGVWQGVLLWRNPAESP